MVRDVVLEDSTEVTADATATTPTEAAKECMPKGIASPVLIDQKLADDLSSAYRKEPLTMDDVDAVDRFGEVS